MGLQMGKPPKSLGKLTRTLCDVLADNTPEDGGRIPLRLAVGDIGNSTGDFWENPSISSAADGKVSTW